MKREISIFNLLGGLLLIGGLMTGIYFLVFFDASVEIPQQEILGQMVGGGRVNNIGLLNDKQNGIYLGFGASVVGLALICFEQYNKKNKKVIS